MALVRRAQDLGALGATISGAGPTVLVWARTEAEAAVTEALEREVSGWARVMPARFEPRGARVLEG
jgi:homoserine kinase